MLVIIAEINGHNSLSASSMAKLKEYCKTVDLDQPINVNSFAGLMEMLDEKRNNTILLFSNFPPDSSYPDSGKTKNTTQVGAIELQAWDADSYEKSRSFFSKILNKYKFRAIHFITGAPKEKLSDELLLTLSTQTPITVTRKRDWIHPDLDYDQLYCLFLIEKIKEAVLKNPFG